MSTSSSTSVRTPRRRLPSSAQRRAAYVSAMQPHIAWSCAIVHVCTQRAALPCAHALAGTRLQALCQGDGARQACAGEGSTKSWQHEARSQWSSCGRDARHGRRRRRCCRSRSCTSLALVTTGSARGGVRRAALHTRRRVNGHAHVAACCPTHARACACAHAVLCASNSKPYYDTKQHSQTHAHMAVKGRWPVSAAHSCAMKT